MKHIGQTKAILIPTKTEVRGTFTAVQKTKLNKATAPCVAEPGYSYTQCMMDYVISTAGCRLDWVHSSRGHGYEPCTTWDQVLQNTHYYYFHTFLFAIGATLQLCSENHRQTFLDPIGQCYRMPCKMHLYTVQF